MFDRFFKKMKMTAGVGVDLGTANTLVYVHGQGIVINEPSVVALNQKTGRVVAVGKQAYQMLGRTPGHVEAVRPLVDGVISNFEVAEEMLAYLIGKALKISKKTARPNVVIGVPSGITNVETRAVYDAARNAGAKEVFIVEEPMAAALGVKLEIREPIGNMIIDIGGGTTDIALISLGGVVRSKNLRIAGDRLNEDIISYIRDEFKILVGERTAEGVKIAIGSVAKNETPMEASIRGRDLVTGLPREVIITDSDIREAIAPSIAALIDSIKEVLESTPPEILSDVMHRGIVLVGGGAMLHGLDALLIEVLKVPIHIATDPLTAVARGTGVILEDIEAYQDIFIRENDDAVPPR
jgi:rod shape-determining protein MreB